MEVRYYYNREVFLIKEIDNDRSLIEIFEYSTCPMTGEESELQVEMIVDSKKLFKEQIKIDERCKEIIDKANREAFGIINNAKIEATNLKKEAIKDKEKIVKDINKYELLMDTKKIIDKDFKYILYNRYGSFVIKEFDLQDKFTFVINYEKKYQKDKFLLKHKIVTSEYDSGSGELRECFCFETKDQLIEYLKNYFLTSDDSKILSNIKTYNEYDFSIQKVDDLIEKNRITKIEEKEKRLNKLQKDLQKEEEELNNLKLNL